MKAYTKIGDKGETRLGDGSATSKGHRRIEVYGTLDELNSWLGLVIASLEHAEYGDLLVNIQRKLFALGAFIANPKWLEAAASGEEAQHERYAKARLTIEDLEALERAIDRYDAKLPNITNFILPGGTWTASRFHFARTVCRRAEREMVRLHEEEPLPELFLPYINRLSDLFFVLARHENARKAVQEVIW